MDSETLIVDPTAEPHRPRPRIGLKDVLCVGPIIANTIYYYVGLPLTPLLLGRNPVLLSALRGSIASMVAAGGFVRVGRVPLLLALLAPIPISMLTDPFFFWAGKRYGRSLINYLSETDPRWRKRCRARRALLQEIRRVDDRPRAVPAGTRRRSSTWRQARPGCRFCVFIIADLIGTLAYIGLIVGAGGRSVSQP